MKGLDDIVQNLAKGLTENAPHTRRTDAPAILPDGHQVISAIAHDVEQQREVSNPGKGR